MHYDAVVMGAGPGGCMAARTLNGAGFKVLVVEKDRIPREKPCGGFLSPEAVGAIEDGFGAIPRDCLAGDGAVNGAVLLCEGGGTYELPFSRPGLSVLRSRLDSFLSSACGAEIMDACEVVGLDIERFHARVQARRDGDEEVVESTYLVGADGADSLALRQLRPEFYRLYAAPRLERTMLILGDGEVDWNPQQLGLILMRKGTGIARFFLKEGHIGLAVNHYGASGWQEELDRLIAFLGENRGLRLEGEPIRQLTSSNRMGAGGHYNLGAGCALLVGEAAGLLDPWGFGIHLALESGRVAAESLIESAGESITPHLRYRYRMQEILERESKQRRDLSGRVGDLETASLVGAKSRDAKRDRRMLRRHFSR